MADGVVVIAGGGGGVPVIEDGPRLIGKEGVVDKDLASAILATEVGASTLLILTDVKKVQRGYGSFMPEDIDRLTVHEAIALLKKGEFGEGSMGPKVEAAASFARSGGRAVIAELSEAPAALAGEAGTADREGLTSRLGTLGAFARPASRVPELVDDQEQREDAHRHDQQPQQANEELLQEAGRLGPERREP